MSPRSTWSEPLPPCPRAMEYTASAAPLKAAPSAAVGRWPLALLAQAPTGPWSGLGSPSDMNTITCVAPTRVPVVASIAPWAIPVSNGVEPFAERAAIAASTVDADAPEARVTDVVAVVPEKYVRPTWCRPEAPPTPPAG